MGYSDTYASNVARIYSDLGRSQAEAKLQSGQAWGNALGQIGNIAQNLPGQLADEKRQKAQQAIWDANLKKLQQQDQEDRWLSDAMNSSVVDGKIDERRLTENLNLLGAAELVPEAVKVIRSSDAALVQLKNAQQQGEINEATLGKLVMGYLEPYAKAIKESDFNPAVINGAVAAIAVQAPQMAQNLAQRFAENPQGIRGLVEELTQPQATKPIEVGGVLLDPSQVDPATGQPKVLFDSRKVEEPKIQSLDDQLAIAFKAGDRKTINAIVKLQADIAAGKRAPERPGAPNYVKVDTVDGAGNPIVTYMTAEEVRAQGGVRGAPKTTAKASGPATVDAILGEIETLSGKINTSAGGPMSNVTGLARQGAAALNMDNDVSEYQALVEGFTPMMARAVGHTGVLTQLDVESVQRLFPRPTDNTQLAKNKLDRVKRIMSAMQDPSVAALGPDASFSDKLGAALAIANKGASGGRSGGAGPAGKGGGLSAEELIKKYGGG